MDFKCSLLQTSLGWMVGMSFLAGKNACKEFMSRARISELTDTKNH